MTQTRFHNYKRPVVSSAENQRLAGIVPPGRIKGFDVMVDTGGLTFNITHTGDNFKRVTHDASPAESNALGIAVTRQGTIIQEDAPIALSIDTNAALPDRYDIVIMTHQFTASTGGTAATYAIIKDGTVTDGVPVVSDPTTQIALGWLTIPAGAAAIASSVTYTPVRNAMDYARLHEINLFTETNYFSQVSIDGNLFITSLVNETETKALPNTGVLDVSSGRNLWYVTNAGPYTLNTIDQGGAQQRHISLRFAVDTLIDATAGGSNIVPATVKYIVKAGEQIILTKNYTDGKWSLPFGVTKPLIKVIEIGDWDMDSTATIDVPHGLSDYSKIRSISIMIRHDSSAVTVPLDLMDTGVVQGGVINTDSINIILQRLTSGYFDSTNYNATSFNRGWVTIIYEI